MEILVIRGENLASLGHPFEIDLQAEPLRSAGLFAIIGATGSGKSTLLDAMCLALYGNCPRLSGSGVDDDVPDHAGDAIKSTDARSLLRRGCTSGYAEVDFVAHDGIPYRARWAARRSRGLSSGRLQPVERSLIRLTDGTVVESQITLVNARVAKELRLSYEEFRRTVLLAQGDFDAFLRANTSERAALLEKITGTGIYREISKGVYERTETEKAALALEQAKLDASRCLSDEDRAGLLKDLSDLQATSDTHQDALKELKEVLDLKRAEGAAREALTLSEAQERAARTGFEMALPQRQLLERIAAYEPLRALHEAAREAASLRIGSEEALSRSTKALDGASAERIGIALRKSKAQSTHLSVEALFKDFGPVWSEATRLDDRIARARSDVSSFILAQTAARETKGSAARRLTEIETRKSAMDQGLLALTDQLDKAPHAKAVEDRLAACRPFLVDHVETMQKTAGLAASRSKTLVRRDEIAAVLAGHAEAETGLKHQIASLGLERDAAVAEIENVLWDKPQERLEAAGRSREMAIELRGLVQRHVEILVAHDLEHREILALGARITRIEERLTLARHEQGLSETAVATLSQPVAMAEDASSSAAAALRARLDPGCPCPVCGSKVHERIADDRLAALARDLRAQLQREQAALDEKRRLCATLTAERQSIIDRKAERERAASALQTACVQTRSEYRDLASILAPEDPRTKSPDPEWVTDLIARADAEKARHMSLLLTLEALRAQETKTSAQITIARGHLDKGRLEASRLAGEHMDCERHLTSIETEISVLEGRRSAGHPNVLEILGLVGTSVFDLQEKGFILVSEIDHLAGWWRDTSKKRADAERDILEIGSERALMAERLVRETEALSLCDEKVISLTQERDALIGQRAELLGGEDTERHRTRINAQRMSAQSELEAATRELAACDIEIATLTEKQSAATAALMQAQIRERASHEKFMAGLGASALSEQEAEDFSKRDTQANDALRSTMADLDLNLERAVTLRQERQADLANVLSRNPTVIPEAEILESLRSLTAEEGRTREQIGSLGEQISADNARRGEMMTLRDIVSALRGQVDTWVAVNAAVGQRSGNKFAQLAQSITLGILVDRANGHLSALKPRYRLQKGGEDLSLQIVDKDMGDEVRSTRSLSGGERFLVSLSLALALSGMGGGGGIARTLFIDEGFGTLDADSLEMAMDALERLQSQGRTIGVISHVTALKSRIPVQIRVEKRSGGKSVVYIPT